MDQKEFIIRRGITDNYPRKLVINENELKFESKDLRNDSFVTFKKDQILEYSYGVKWMQYKFTFGREYIISIRSNDNQIIKINFKTYFGRKKDEYHKLCNDILLSLWDFYFGDLTSNYIQKSEQGEEFKIGEVIFNKDGLSIISNSSLKQKSVLIQWEKVRTKRYSTYFTIYSKDDAVNVNRGYSYLNDWNTTVLLNVLNAVLAKKNIITD